MYLSVLDPEHAWLDLPAEVGMTPGMKSIYEDAVRSLPTTTLNDVLADELGPGLCWQNGSLTLKDWDEPVASLWSRSWWHPRNFWYRDWPWKLHEELVAYRDKIRNGPPEQREEFNELYLGEYEMAPTPNWRVDYTAQGLLAARILLTQAHTLAIARPVHVLLHLSSSFDVPEGYRGEWEDNDAAMWIFLECVRPKSGRAQTGTYYEPSEELLALDQRVLAEIGDAVEAERRANPATLYVMLEAAST
jgi:hypothetical protein